MYTVRSTTENSLPTDVPPQTAARVAGWAYLGIFVLAFFANFFVRTRLIDPDDGAATVRSIQESEGLFRAGVGAFLVVLALDVVVAWALYLWFRPAGSDLARLAAWLRLGYSAILGVAVAAFLVVLELVGDGGYEQSLGTRQRAAMVQLFANSFEATWAVGLALFGLHLVVVGLLVRRSGAMPRALGTVLIVAGLGYVIDTFARAILPGYDTVQTAFLAIYALPSIAGELWLAIWLLRKGTRPPVRVEPAAGAARR